MKWIYPKGKPTDKIDLAEEHRKQQQALEARYAMVSERTKSQVLIYTLVLLIIASLGVLGIQRSLVRIYDLQMYAKEVKATVVDSSDVSKIDMVFRWSELEYEVDGIVQSDIIKYSMLSTEVGTTALVYYDTEANKIYTLSTYYIYIVLFIS